MPQILRFAIMAIRSVSLKNKDSKIEIFLSHTLNLFGIRHHVHSRSHLYNIYRYDLLVVNIKTVTAL